MNQTTYEEIISINELRRKFGEIEKTLPYVNHFTVTKNGKPFAVLTAAPQIKKELMKKTAGKLKGTALDQDTLWKEVGKRKSRIKNIVL